MHDHTHIPTHTHTIGFWRKWGKKLALLAGATWLLSGIFFVRADEEAVIRRFGRALRPAAPPGVHMGFPWPIDRIARVKIRESKRVSVGFQMPDMILGRQPSAAETQFFTGDRNIVEIQMMVQYMVQDPIAFLFQTADIEALVGKVAETTLTDAVAQSGVDALLTTGRSQLQQTVYRATQESLNALETGVQIVSVDLQLVAPPPEVADAFRDVASARGDRDRIINEAQGYMNDNLPRARGEGQRLRLLAEAYQRDRIDRATGEADRFLQLYGAYRASRDITAQRLYFEAMEEILPRLNIMIVDPNRENTNISIIREAP
jgi:modulator of FtsH protease HflK